MEELVAALILTLIGLTCSAPSPEITRTFQVEDADARMTVPQLIEKYNYTIEVHHTTTEDGYELELHRIPGKAGSPVVFLMHGLLCSSADWVIIGPNNGLAYLLADQGFDVWLGNARGNRYSRQHTSLTPNMFAFWQFSWHEIGYYDLPAMIDYTLNHTNQSNLHYIGHSQGTTVFFVMTSTRPEYNAKIQLMQAFAPVAFTENVRSPLLQVMSRFQNSLVALFETFGIGEFLPNNAILHEIARLLCSKDVDRNLCLNVIFQVAGANPDQVELQIIPILIGHTPAGAATRQVTHYAQGMRSRQFQRYDHGKIKNLAVYGTARPPVYNVSEISAPIVLYYGANDFLAEPADVLRLGGMIRNLHAYRQVELNTFNHLDFLIAKDVKGLVYDDVIKRLQSWED
ncbi:lipase 1-like [Ochlerotatus camptorhynchus]|uniref:lipase 1-like n=1 Tax=Ochlerotatus camptorhynchus TaxID=644619 RepID=UPI0031D9502F